MNVIPLGEGFLGQRAQVGFFLRSQPACIGRPIEEIEERPSPYKAGVQTFHQAHPLVPMQAKVVE